MVLTKNAIKRMKLQGWVFDQRILYDGVYEVIYRHTLYPGVYFITQGMHPGYALFMSDEKYQKN